MVAQKTNMIIERDVPITASDGLVLRADVYRPDTTTPVPVVMVLGPYGKGVEYKTGYSAQWKWLTERHPSLLPGSTRSYETWETVDPEIWTAWGYACVRVDSRGTGRTPGKLDVMSARETRDFYDAIEWAGTVSWSNGKVGLNGISYYAMTQWRVAPLQPPHLAAMIPWEGCGDAYRDWLRVGGIASNAFFEAWYERQVTSNQHGNPAGRDDPWLGDKATGPDARLSEEELAANRRDTMADIIAHPLEDDYWLERSVADWSKVTVPFLSAANWGAISGLHARGNYEGFVESASSQKWLEVHVGRHDEAFYIDEAMALQRRFFDHFLKGEANGWEREPRVMYTTRKPGNPSAGQRTDVAWPLSSTQFTKYFLSGRDSSISAAAAAADESSVTFEAMGDAAVFRSAPLAAETEITGPLAAKLFVSSSTADADLFVTVQAFGPDGDEVEFQGAWDPHTPLSQGWLRASHRKLDPRRSRPYQPYHSHDEHQPLHPGAVYELDVEIWPTHIILPRGYRVVVRVEGKDFERPADGGEYTLTGGGRGSGPFIHNHPQDRGSDTFKGRTTIHTGGQTASYLLLPIIPS